VELRDYLRVLRRGWPILLAFVVLGTALGVGATLASKKVYEATVEVFVATSAGTSGSDLANGNTFSQFRVQSYTSFANAPAVIDPVLTKLGLPLTPDQLASEISANAPLNKVLINLHVKDHDPRRAALLANAVADQFVAVVQRTEQTDSTGKPVVHLTVVRPATAPTSAVSPSKTLNIGLGFAIGLVVGVGLVVIRDLLDNTVKGPEDFAELGVPVLGYVPFDKRTAQNAIAFRGDAHSARSEAYRQLRTNLQFVNVDKSPRVIAITSAIPGEGKTTTAVNLASALAEAGYRVCLVDADLRRPSLAKVLGLVDDVGFTTVLIGKAPLEDVLQKAGRNLAVLTSGAVPPNPTELLMSRQAYTILRQIADEVDYVIIDSAPLLPVADGAEVAALADATLIVHHAGKSTRHQAADSIGALAKVGTRPVGVVLNMITRRRGQYDDAYGYYYAAYRPDRSNAASTDPDAAKPKAKAPPEHSRPTPLSAPSARPKIAASGFQYSRPAQYRSQTNQGSQRD
jgi:capsular exopolysaccharide synthesis family protein